MPNFPRKMAEVCVAACRAHGAALDKALDAGCGPGGTALELCSAFKLVNIITY